MVGQLACLGRLSPIMIRMFGFGVAALAANMDAPAPAKKYRRLII
jgi:hypothetical protein